MHYITKLSVLQKLYLLAVVFYIIPIWLLDFFPSLDGVSHIANGITLNNLLLDKSSLYHEFYALNTYPTPNWLSYGLSALFSNFLSPDANEKLMVSICILLFISAYHYLVISINRENEYLAYFALLFALSGPLIYGAYNFFLSLSFFMFGLGYWLKTPRPNFFILFTIFGLAYFSHIFGFAILCLAIFICYFTIRRNFLHAALIPFLASSLFLSLFLYYLSADFHKTSLSFPYIMKFREFFFPANFFLWDIRENIFSALIFIFIWTLFLSGAVKKRSPLTILIGVLVIALFATPSQLAGGWVIEPRINLVILILASACGAASTTKMKRRIAAIIITLSLSYTVYNQLMFRSMQPALRDFYSAADHIDKGSKIMSVNFINHITPTEDGYKKSLAHYYLTNTATMLATVKNAVDLYNYEPIEKNVFPLIFRDPAMADDKLIAKLRSTHFANQTGNPPSISQSPDFLLVWYRDDLIIDKERIAAKNKFLTAIQKDYTLVHTSNLKLMHVYKHK